MRLISATILVGVLALTACGGGGGGTGAAPTRSPASQGGKLVLSVPASTSSDARAPKYISPAAVSIGISANGGAQTVADISAGSPNCTTGTGGRTCTISFTAPVGNDTFVISQYSGANATGSLLGSGTATATVVLGQTFTITATLNGVLGTIQLTLGTPPNQGAPGTTTLSVTGLDPAGQTIVGPGNYTNPITLTVTDPLNQTTLSSTTVTAPLAGPLTVTYAGGLNVYATITATSPGAPTVSVPFEPNGSTPFIYVTDPHSNALSAFSITATGNVAPVRKISGNLTGLNYSRSLAIDSAGNIYVSNAGSTPPSILVFAPRSSGNVAPIRTISGANTGLTGPSGLSFDALGDLLVANCSGCYLGSGTDAVYTFAPGANGNVAPIATLSGPNTGLYGTTDTTLDGLGNLLTTVASATPTINFYPAGANGDIAFTGQIGGSNTDLDGAGCVVVDASGEINVCNNVFNSITVYPSGSRGNVGPSRILYGANTGLSYPSALFYDSSGNMFVANNVASGGITVYAPGANGNQAPIRTIAGAATGLNGTTGIAPSP